MITTPQMQNCTGSPDAITRGAVHLMLGQGDVKLMAENSELVMADLRQRAEQVGSVLNEILNEPHGEPRWGLNE